MATATKQMLELTVELGDLVFDIKEHLTSQDFKIYSDKLMIVFNKIKNAEYIQANMTPIIQARLERPARRQNKKKKAFTDTEKINSTLHYRCVCCNRFVLKRGKIAHNKTPVHIKSSLISSTQVLKNKPNIATEIDAIVKIKHIFKYKMWKLNILRVRFNVYVERIREQISSGDVEVDMGHELDSDDYND